MLLIDLNLILPPNLFNTDLLDKNPRAALLFNKLCLKFMGKILRSKLLVRKCFHEAYEKKMYTDFDAVPVNFNYLWIFLCFV